MKVPTKSNIELRLERLANFYGYELNPNQAQRDTVIRGLIKNLIKYGYTYCPCSILRNEDNICPCENLHEDIKKNGTCHCRLFFKKKEEEPELGFC